MTNIGAIERVFIGFFVYAYLMIMVLGYWFENCAILGAVITISMILIHIASDDYEEAQ